MPFFDILDEVSQRQIQKTDMGENRMFGVVIGQVTKNYDMSNPGLIRISITARDYEEEKQVWARVAYPYSGQDWGQYFLPEVGDQVLVVFENGDINRPYVIGSVPKSTFNFTKKLADENNTHKEIKTKNGNTISFEDNAEGQGANDKITIKTSTEAHKIELNNEKKQIKISDKDGENQIVMKTESGQMEITAKTKLTIKVGDNLELIMNGNNGTLQIKSTKITMEASNSASIKSNNTAKIEGGNVTLTGNSMLKLESSGPVNVSGTPIKLG
ncbi:MAG: phage baseplate assembly protein V [Butyrivibrio sp.]|nr:phage baseplate assembly protein V [Butyrivibrio sp.]